MGGSGSHPHSPAAKYEERVWDLETLEPLHTLRQPAGDNVSGWQAMVKKCGGQSGRDWWCGGCGSSSAAGGMREQNVCTTRMGILVGKTFLENYDVS